MTGTYTRRFGWFCSCGAIIDMEISGPTPTAVENRRKATTVGWLSVHIGEGHDTKVTRAEAVKAWEAKFGEDPEAERPPMFVMGQIRGDGWVK